MAKDRRAWLDCFAEDAVVHDPVGGSPVDPDGLGLMGHAGLERFWDALVAPMSSIRFQVRQEHRAGRSVARVATVTAELDGVGALTYDGVFVYDLDDEGRIAALRGYFELPVG